MTVPFVPAPSCARVELIFTSDTQKIENSYHVKQALAFNATSLLTLATVFYDWWHAELCPHVHSSAVLSMVRATALDARNSPGVELTDNLPEPGGYTSNVMAPLNCTVAVKWSTGLRGRSYRGRTYHIGLPMDQVSGNRLVSQYITDIQGAYSQLRGFYMSGGQNLVVVSRRQDKQWLNEAVVTTITGVSINAVIDSQRRRLPERGS